MGTETILNQYKGIYPLVEEVHVIALDLATALNLLTQEKGKPPLVIQKVVDGILADLPDDATWKTVVGSLNDLKQHALTIVAAINNNYDSITATNTNIGDLTLLTDTATNLVSAINEVVADIGTVSSTIGSLSSLVVAATSIVNALNAVNARAGNIETIIGDTGDLTFTATDLVDALNKNRAAINTTVSNIGSVASLSWADATTVVSAINHNYSLIGGELTGLSVTATSLIAAINTATTNISTNASAIGTLANTLNTLITIDLPMKANKINYPHIDWITDLSQTPSVPMGRSLQFNLPNPPDFTGFAPLSGRTSGAFLYTVVGIMQGFGPYVTSDGIRRFGAFDYGTSELIPIMDVWTSSNGWLSPSGIGQGRLRTKFTFSAPFTTGTLCQTPGTFTSFDMLTDITVVDEMKADLIEVHNDVMQNVADISRIQSKKVKGSENIQKLVDKDTNTDPLATIGYVSSALSAFNEGGLKTPVPLDKESNLPDVATAVRGDYYVIEDMDITKEGYPGRAWFNPDVSTTAFQKVVDFTHSPDTITIDLNSNGNLQITDELQTLIHGAIQEGDIVDTVPSAISDTEVTNVISQYGIYNNILGGVLSTLATTSKTLISAINELKSSKQDALYAYGQDYIMTWPNSSGGSPGKVDKSAYQAAINAEAEEEGVSILTAPETKGMQPGTIPSTTFQSAIIGSARRRVLLAPLEDGGEVPTSLEENFILASVINSGTWNRQPEAGPSALIIQSGVRNNFNEGIRINVADETLWGGIVIGGRPDSKNGMDAQGYSSNQADRNTRNGTWFVASNPSGDLVISTSSPGAVSHINGFPTFYIKRTGEMYGMCASTGNPSQIPTYQDIWKSAIKFNSTQLGVPTSDQSTATTYPLTSGGSNPNILVLYVNDAIGTAILQGYLPVGVNFTGGTQITTGSFTIPNRYLPNISDQVHIMGNFTLNRNYRIFKPCQMYLICPSNHGDGCSSTFYLRMGQEGEWAPGYYQEAFFNMSWNYYN